MGPTPTRRYRMQDRAAAVADTRAAIIGAAIELGDPRAPLSAISSAAEVSERTILRHFGSRAGLTAAAMSEATDRIRAERFGVEPGDLDGAVENLVQHYERHGDQVISRLAEEGRNEAVDAIIEAGRRLHREWVEQKLGPLVGDPGRATRRRRLAQLVAVCEVYTWKLLRRDMRLGAAETEKAVVELIHGLIEGERR
jgi:AcrR family transcriptional regulator